ncbi:hypothetical protein Q3F64_10465 [Enterococcus faecium]|uniref:hypothetical protein n=1 Tax=Bacteria TaxID=2 RepID=UPI000A32BD66|nr:hypothetical protein [Enterococcus faecium]EGP5101765.1 hypothetical protein [Enterococcus faecium]EME8132408.1 hypothetical protein [Enterococcus faecium]MCD4947648.1 hypothetical protein [Enterococcus faecium]MDN3039261.1 hypothetical protein [Enterococcus faecium]MDQ8292618.1 hypothetical protein [Enterococcus faecium]
MDELAKKKFVQHKIRTTYYQSNATIPKIVVNQLANVLYKEFEELAGIEQEKLLLSEELVMALWNKYMERVNRELLEEA